MDKLINIVGILRSYVNRCAKCDIGRKKNCPWIAAFATSAATAIQEGATHEERALAVHETAGSPCKNQLTFADFIDQVYARKRYNLARTGMKQGWVYPRRYLL